MKRERNGILFVIKEPRSYAMNAFSRIFACLVMMLLLAAGGRAAEGDAGPSLIKNGDLTQKVNTPVYHDKLTAAGFPLPSPWYANWFIDPGSKPPKNLRAGESDSGNTIEIIGGADTIVAPHGAYDPGAYELRFDYRLKTGGKLKIIAYRYGSKWEWRGTRDIRVLGPADGWQTVRVGVVVPADGNVAIVRPGFAVWGDIELRRVYMVAVPETKAKALNETAFRLRPEDWRLELVDGAEGSIQAEGDGLIVSKTNGAGHLRLVSRAPVKLVEGERYSYRVMYHSENAPLWSQMLVRLTTDPEADNFPMPYGLYRYMGGNHIVNSPPGVFQKRIMNFECASEPSTDKNLATRYPAEVYPVLLVHGNPVTIDLGPAEIYPARRSASSARKTYEIGYDEAAVLERLAKRRPVATELVRDGNTVKLAENGRFVPPVFYMASENNELVGDFHSFGKAGIAYAIAPVKLIDYQKPERSVWRGPGKYDFAEADRWLMDVLRKNPDAKLVIHYWVTPYDGLGDDLPDEIWRNERGLRYYGNPRTTHITGASNDAQVLAEKNARWMLSYHSPRWKEESTAALTALTEHFRRSPFANAIAGFFIFSGIDGRLQPGPVDYSPAALNVFTAAMKKKYGDIQALNRAWRTDFADFGALGSHRYDGGQFVFPGDTIPVYTDNVASVEYRTFHYENIWRLLDGWGGAIKRAWKTPAVVGVYRDFDRTFLDMPNLDFNGNDVMYMTRNEGYAGAAWYPLKTAYNRKLWCMDLDIRSYAGPQIADEMWELFVGAGMDYERWLAIHNKLVGACLAGNAGYWYFDMLAYFQDEAIMKTIKETTAIAARVAERKNTFSPDVAVVISPAGKLFSNVSLNAYNGTLGFWGFNHEQGAALATAGVPWDMFYVEDLVKTPELQNYKMYIFANTVHLSAAERDFIESKLKKDGRTLVFLYDSGYIGDAGKDVEAMGRLAGMQIATDGRFARQNFHMLVDGVLPFQNGAEFALFNFRQRGWPVSQLAPGQNFWVDDPDAVPLARYDDGRVAMAKKRHGDYTAVYLAAPNALGNDFFNRLVRGRGLYAFGDAGPYAFMNGNFVSLHALRSGDYSFRLPPGARRLVDAFTGEVIPAEGDSCRLNLVATRTYWYFIE